MQRYPVTAELSEESSPVAWWFPTTADTSYSSSNSPNAAGSAHLSHDAQAPATLAERISPADTELQFAVAPRLNATGTVVYYGGRAPLNGGARAYRSNLASGTPQPASHSSTAMASVTSAWTS